jgi:ABC-type polar amino acid transport system ATPase subunit
MLKVENLRKKINNKVLFQGLDFHIRKGEILVFLGGSGTGKTTLLRILNNLDNCEEATVFLEGEKSNFASLRKNGEIGMVFQNFNLFENMTVEGNITFILKKTLGKTEAEAKEISTKLLKRYDLLDKAQRSVNNLSGGQKQRLAIARTLALNPKIICLDEPTSALDPRLTFSLAQSIEDLSKRGHSIFLTTHDVSFLEKLNCKILLLKEGQICETADSFSFFQNRNDYPQINDYVTGSI